MTQLQLYTTNADLSCRECIQDLK